MTRIDTFNEIFASGNNVASNGVWKKVGDNYTQYSTNQASSYVTETSCNLKSK